MNLVSKKELQVMNKVRLAEKIAPIVDHLEDGGESVEELWSTLKSTIHEVAMETIGERPVIPQGRLYASEQTKLLSELQRPLRMDIQAALTQILQRY